ncbi:MAG: FHA domain-containing protein [Candidatus Eremiobacteraeota bacterium]|nr:FHA domain-containing protein [Candidatus Eremiobacteraeota bacterium]MCW5869959.1 FHA domain-containing protein [Candidatus Eremiobacteraeota bacterium]
MAWNSGYQLRILKGNQQGLVVPLTEQVYILGRATSQGETAPGYMFFYEPTVSRVHAELRWNEKKKAYFVHHQSKTNPTLVEGLPVDKKTPRPLEKGHKIQMGYLVLEVEPASEQSQVALRGAPAAAPPKEDSSKTHKMMVGNILEALSNLSAERNPAGAGAAPPNTNRLDSRPQPRAAEPEAPRQPSGTYLERDYGASDQATNEIQFTVAQGPDKGEIFVLKEQVGIVGRAMGRDDPRRGQGVLLQDDSLPKEAAYVVWQSRDNAYGLSESDTPGVAIRVRRVHQGQPQDLAVGNGPPVLLQDGDVIQLGRSALVCRVKGATPLKTWSPQDVERPAPPVRPASVPLPPSAPPVSPPQEDWAAQAGPPSPWGRPSEPSGPPRSISLNSAQAPAPPPEGGGGIVPRNFPGSGSLGVAPTPPVPFSRVETETTIDEPEAPTTFRVPKPPTPPRMEPTLIGRNTGGLGSRSDLTPVRPTAPVPEPPTREVTNRPIDTTTPQTTPLDPSTVPTLSGSAPGRTPMPVSDDRPQELIPLSWPWRDASDFVFDFTSGPNRGRQIALNAGEMQDDRVITLGSNSDQFDIPLDGTNNMAALRYRSRRFALLNQGPDDSVQVNRVPLKRGDQVVLMTGDRIDIGESTFRYLERAVVEVLQSFQIVVESGVDQDQDKVYPFSKQRLLIGRGKNCDVRLSDLEVSRIHVALVHRDGRFFVQHRSETNPTFLNGMSLLQGGEREIHTGDRIRLSSLTLLQFAKAESRKRASATGR